MYFKYNTFLKSSVQITLNYELSIAVWFFIEPSELASLLYDSEYDEILSSYYSLYNAESLIWYGLNSQYSTYDEWVFNALSFEVIDKTTIIKLRNNSGIVYLKSFEGVFLQLLPETIYIYDYCIFSNFWCNANNHFLYLLQVWQMELMISHQVLTHTKIEQLAYGH